MQNGPKAVWSIPYVSVAFFPSLKQNFIAYRSSKVSSRPDCIFKIHQLSQSGFSRIYFNFCCSCSFEAEIIKIGQSSHKMYSNNILNFQESTTILNACTKKSGNLLKATRMGEHVQIAVSRDHSSKCMKTEALFIKTEMNNEWNVHFLQNTRRIQWIETEAIFTKTWTMNEACSKSTETEAAFTRTDMNIK